jgi:hypothetical protein
MGTSFSGYFTMPSICGIASNGRIIIECSIGKCLQGSGRGLVEILSCNLPGGTDESHEEPQLIYRVSQARFESSTSRILIYVIVS